jgi:hypothetical protein
MPVAHQITLVIAHFEDLLARGLRVVIDGDATLEVVAGDDLQRSARRGSARPSPAGGDPRCRRAGEARAGPGPQSSASRHSVGADGKPAHNEHVCPVDRVWGQCVSGTRYPGARSPGGGSSCLARPSAHTTAQHRVRGAAGRGVPAAHPAGGRDPSTAPTGQLKRPDRPIAAGGRRDGPNSCAQHLPQARGHVPSRVGRDAVERFTARAGGRDRTLATSVHHATPRETPAPGPDATRPFIVRPAASTTGGRHQTFVHRDERS